MKTILKKILPNSFFNLYFFLWAYVSSLLYGSPSKKMIIIGITGTKGKTSTSNFIWSVLEHAGIKTGIISTANIRIGTKEFPNTFHMSMPGRTFLQKTLRKMVNEGCKVAVVETTSQGIMQYRHIGIDYDVAIFTNLSPEHIEAHGSYENYKQAKGRLFEVLTKSKTKLFKGNLFPKTIIANIDSKDADYFLSFGAVRKQTFSMSASSDIRPTSIVLSDKGSSFEVFGHTFSLGLPGNFNIYNALPAIAIGRLFDIPLETIATNLTKINVISGRMEEVQTGKGFRVFVDYAHEPAGLQAVIETANQLKQTGSKSIVLVGAPGGGRDKGKRAPMGRVAGAHADIVVVSDDEPYEEDPQDILNAIKKGAEESGKKEHENLFVIGDRREGIKKMLSLAKAGDILVFTGMGHQTVRAVGKEAVSWVEKEIVKEELKSIDHGVFN